MMPALESNIVILPLLIPLVAGLLALPLWRRPRLQAGWSIGMMTLSFLVSLKLLFMLWQTGTPIVFQSGDWPFPFGITFVSDWLSTFFLVMAQLVLVTGLIYAYGSSERVTTFPMFYTLFLALAVGVSGVFLTGDLFNLFVFAELLVITSTVLTASSDDRYGTEAAYKYFYVSQLAATFLLLGIGSLYVCYGTLNLADIGAHVAADPSPRLLMPAIGFLMAAFMVKSAVFPFHSWQPDIYSASPTAVGAMLSSVVAKVGVYGFLRMTTLLFVDQAPTLRAILIVLGVIGIVYGGLAALGTRHLKRMMAYSTLAQIGFILVAIGWGTPAALAAALVFTFNHSLIKAAMLMLSGYVANRAPARTGTLHSVMGLGKAMPLAGVLFFMSSLALSGVPPTNGFISKALVFRSGIGVEQYLSLAIIAAASVLTLIYTMRTFQHIWWQAPAENVAANLRTDKLWAPVILVSLIVILGVWANPLIAVAQQTSLWLADASQYIQLVSLALGG